MKEDTLSLKNRPFPKYAILPVLVSFASNYVFYSIPMALCGSLYHYDMTTAFDKLVPVIPAFTPIYLSFFFAWLINYTLAAYRGKEFFYKFLVADMIGRFICTLFFVFLPTTNVRPVIEVSNIFDSMLVNLVYANDSATNLFPSVHCFVSFMCYMAVGGKDSVIPKGYRVFSLIYALLIFIATQVLKQHVIADLFSAVIIAWGMLAISKRTKLYVPYMKFFTKLNRLVHLETDAEDAYL